LTHEMSLGQDGISRLTDLVYHGDNWTIFVSGNCDCVRKLRGYLSEIEKRFFWGNRGKYFHVALVTTPLMSIYCFKQRLVSRKRLSEILSQEIPEGPSIFSMSDNSDPSYKESENEILYAIAKEEQLKKNGVDGQ